MSSGRIHPAAWWLWALGLAVAALRVTNPVVLLLLAGVVVVVGAVGAEGPEARRTLRAAMVLAAVVLVARVLLQLSFGHRTGDGHVLLSLPSVPMPSWAAGITIGGPVTAESVLAALATGLRLAVVLLCFGAANVLGPARRLLRSLPPVAHEAAVALTVAVCFVPELTASLARVREARLLRGRPTSGLAGLRGMAVPVLEDALDRSIALAASMGARGFGRRGPARSRARSRAGLLVALLGSALVLVGGYGSLAGEVPAPIPMLIVGLLLLVAASLLSARQAIRTRHRPDGFGWAAVLVAGSGWAAAILLDLAGRIDPTATTWSASPLAWPTVSPLALLASLLASAPGLLLASAPSPARRAASVEVPA